MAIPVKKRVRPTGKRAPAKRAGTVQLDPIITVDATGKIQSASNSVRRVFGWEPSDLLGRDIRTILHRSHATMLASLLSRSGKARRAATLAKPPALKAVRKDGTAVPIDLTVSAADVPGHPVPVFVILIRAKRETAAGRLSDKAERARLLAVVAEQSKAIAAAHSRLRQGDRMAAIGTLAAGLGHDMNNVLLPIRAHLNAIGAKHCHPDGREHLLAVQRSIGYLQQLSDGLHQFTLDPEVDSGHPVTNLRQWWKDVGGLLSDAVPADVAVHVELDPLLPAVVIEPHRLTQVMLNLIVNAGEALSLLQEGAEGAGGAGGAGKRPAEKAVRIWAKVDAASDVVQLGITDNGPGMTADVARRAFELFFTTKVRGLGSGLGMAMVQRLITGAGGSVKVQSRSTSANRSSGAKAETGTTIVLSLRIAPITKRTDGADAMPLLPRPKRAVVSVADSRVASMVRLVLETAVSNERAGRLGRPGFEVVAGSEPGDADVWVTDSSAAALLTAERWCASDCNRRVLLTGVADSRLGLKWKELGAVVIEDVGHFQEIRLGLARALAV